MKLKSFFANLGRKFSGVFEIFVNVFDELLRRILYLPEFFFGWLLRSVFKKKNTFKSPNTHQGRWT